MAEQKTSGMAITALVMGILSIILGWIPIIGWIIIILAIIFGFVGLSQTKDPNVKGKGMAIAGIVIGLVMLIIPTLLIMIGALAYFGALSPTELMPERCTVTAGFSCNEFMLTTSGVQMILTNNLGEEIIVEGISEPVKAGESFSLNIADPSLSNMAGEKQKVEFRVTYLPVGKTIKKTLTGEVLGEVQ